MLHAEERAGFSGAVLIAFDDSVVYERTCGALVQRGTPDF
jgi:hypothetical protein